jgi:8-oxo-dGTP pyrophosphatase MutT (NUDIX family)
MDDDIKIYCNDRVIVLTDKNIKSAAIGNDQVYVFENKKALAKKIIRFEESDDEYLCITHDDIHELFEHTAACFKYIEAAGGLVTLPDNRILVIKRRGKWDLPKGKAEKGESLKETAVREVVEECGLIVNPQITHELAHTYHVYYPDGKSVLKHTAWFAMSYDGDDSVFPQTEEDISDVVWLPENQLNIVLQNTYESVKHVLNRWLATYRKT